MGDPMEQKAPIVAGLGGAALVAAVLSLEGTLLNLTQKNNQQIRRLRISNPPLLRRSPLTKQALGTPSARNTPRHNSIMVRIPPRSGASAAIMFLKKLMRARLRSPEVSRTRAQSV